MTDEPVNILLIEDNPGDARLIREMLRELTADRFALEQADRLATGLARLAEGGVYLVLLDLSLPDSQGLDTVVRTRAQAPEAPIVVLTGNDDEALALKTLEIGAEDYLFKGDVDERTLSRTIRYAIERQQAKTALRLREQHFRALIENSADAIALVAPDGTVLYESPSTFRMLGYSPEERVGQNVFGWLHPDDVAGTSQVFGELLQKPGGSLMAQFRFRHKDGAWRWIEATGTNLLGEPSVQAVVVNYRDVTGRKEVEAALQASEARFRGLLEFAPDAALIVNHEGRITFANPQAEKMFGYRRDELLSGSVDMLVPDHVREQHAHQRGGYMGAPRARPMDSGLELRGRRKDGSEFDVDIMLGPLEREGELSVLCIVRDISERKRAEQALRERERQLSSIYDTAADVIFHLAVETEGRYRFASVNQAFRLVTGLGYDQVVGKRVDEVIPEPSLTLVLEKYGEAIREKRIVRWEETSEYPTGRLTGEVSVAPVIDDAGNCTHLVGAVHDVTERKRAEAALAAKNEELRAMTQQLWQTAKLATMGELAASIAHELNNPLGTVSLRVEGLLAQAPPDSPQRRALEVVAREVERMGTLVAGLLHFSRRGARQISTLDVREELEQTLELIHYQLRQRQISVRREFAPAVPLVQADRQQLRQLFLNLFTNASDAMPQGGTLTIRVQGGAGQVVMEIADTGEGIAAEALPQVLEPFFTTKPEGKGTGLGLAICRRILQEHGGTLDLSSDGVGHGASVHLTLPTAASDRAVRAET